MKEFIEKLIGRFKGAKSQENTPIDIIWNKAINECISRANELAEEFVNDCCKWKFTKSIADGGYFYSSGCNHKRFSDLHSFEFCPYCGKKIKVVE